MSDSERASSIPSDLLSGQLRRGRTHPLVVDDLNNDRELALRRALVDEDDPADLDEALEVGGSLNRLEMDTGQPGQDTEEIIPRAAAGSQAGHRARHSPAARASTTAKGTLLAGGPGRLAGLDASGGPREA